MRLSEVKNEVGDSLYYFFKNRGVNDHDSDFLIVLTAVK